MNNYQNIDFNDTNLYIGIDVHKKNWEVIIRCNGMQLERFNVEASVKHLAAFLNKTYPIIVCPRQAGLLILIVFSYISDIKNTV